MREYMSASAKHIFSNEKVRKMTHLVNGSQKCYDGL